MRLLLTRILWLRRSKWQFLLAGTAFFFGLSALMIALNAFLRVEAVQQKQLEKGQYLMLSKKISMVNTLGIETGSFSSEEVNNIRKSGLFQEVGEVYSNKFRAQIFSENYIQFQSLVFFESVPRRFLDQNPVEFRWSEGQNELPILVSQDFLNLYNFGFALGQGLPQVGKETLKMLSFRVLIDGPGGKREFKGRIAGFTERIASVLVPSEFMEWANKNVGGQEIAASSRVMAKVANPSEPAIGHFLKKYRLSTEQEKLQSGKIASVLNLVMKGLGILGLLFSGLALVMFSTNFRLVMAEAESDIRLLIELGYAHKTLAFQLLFWFALLLMLVFAASSLFLLRMENLIANTISVQGIQGGGGGFLESSLAAGFTFTLMVAVWNGILILNQLRRIA
jgi:hypothetical protein